jgi:hypothetical protein
LISLLSEFDPSDLVVFKIRNGEWASPDTVRVIPGGLDIGSVHTPSRSMHDVLAAINPLKEHVQCRNS